MIIRIKNEFYLVRADNVQVGDKMMINANEAKVTEVRNHMIDHKVAIETESGTLQVNGVLTSGLCEDNPESVEKILMFDVVIQNYTSSHFGNEYKNLCMDDVAWKNAYLINNGLEGKGE